MTSKAVSVRDTKKKYPKALFYKLNPRINDLHQMIHKIQITPEVGQDKKQQKQQQQIHVVQLHSKTQNIYLQSTAKHKTYTFKTQQSTTRYLPSKHKIYTLKNTKKLQNTAKH